MAQTTVDSKEVVSKSEIGKSLAILAKAAVTNDSTSPSDPEFLKCAKLAKYIVHTWKKKFYSSPDAASSNTPSSASKKATDANSNRSARKTKEIEVGVKLTGVAQRDGIRKKFFEYLSTVCVTENFQEDNEE